MLGTSIKTLCNGYVSNDGIIDCGELLYDDGSGKGLSVGTCGECQDKIRKGAVVNMANESLWSRMLRKLFHQHDWIASVKLERWVCVDCKRIGGVVESEVL